MTSQQDTKGAELPPGRRIYRMTDFSWGSDNTGASGAFRVVTHSSRSAAADYCWQEFGIPRAAYLDMKAKAERTETAEAESVADEHVRRFQQAEMLRNFAFEERDGLRARIAELEAQLAEARREAENQRDCFYEAHCELEDDSVGHDPKPVLPWEATND